VEAGEPLTLADLFTGEEQREIGTAMQQFGRNIGAIREFLSEKYGPNQLRLFLALASPRE
jgi:hypothetical protein